ncbi:MAG: hypothetical protein D6B28_06960 [Gammaproteobacteria bacterium]|nr:MAG: hypothetical protein D6B28_06960 [Gammaproteobacteria bacterium]
MDNPNKAGELGFLFDLSFIALLLNKISIITVFLLDLKAPIVFNTRSYRECPDSSVGRAGD